MSPTSSAMTQIEQILNLLMAEDGIRQRRTAAATYLKERLERNVSRRMKQSSLGVPELTALASGEKPLFPQVIQRLTEMGISREKRSELRTVACAGAGAAEKQLRLYLYDQELAKVYKESGLGHTSWRAFLESSGYISPETAGRIAAAAHMEPAERQEFLDRQVRDSFEDFTCLRPKLWELMGKKDISPAVLKRRTLLSARAWAPLAKGHEPGGDEDTDGSAPKAKERVSQSTLLRLTVGLRLSRADAEALLASAGSGFIMRRDLVVLSAILLGIYDSWDVFDILEEYARSPYGERYFGNIYQSRSVIG